MNVSRDVIRDLWALCQASEASDDSRRLVDAFLAEDHAFAESLRSAADPLAGAPPALPPDHAARTFDRARQRLARRSPLRVLGLAFTGLAVLRLLQATTFTKSPTEVIALGAAAVAFWIAYGWHTRWLQQRAVFGSGARQRRGPRSG
jgi:hypothetical protein